MLVCGKNVFKEIVKNPDKINKVYLLKEFNDKKIISDIKNFKLEVYFLSKKEFEEFDMKNNQGIIIDIKDYDYKNMSVIKEGELVVILDHIEDPHNFGAIIRTCEAAGIKNIIIPKNRSVRITSTVMKTSAGALDRVNIILVTNIVSAMNELKDKGYWIVATDLDGKSHDEIDYKGNIAIVIGSEGSGISRLVKKESDFIATIKLEGQINSLNASVAAGIILFEAIKQRR